MGIGIRSFGSFAGGAASGIERGARISFAKQSADQEKDLYAKQGKAYDEMASATKAWMAKQAPTVMAAMQQQQPVAAAGGGVETGDQLARMEGPPPAVQAAAQAEPSMLAKQLMAPGAPTRFVTRQEPRRLPFSAAMPLSQEPVE
jgi:hypothetical protein